MRQSIAYTQTLNIMIVFITIIFAFLLAILNYYKAYKVSNALTDVIEKYEGYNSLAEEAILRDMATLGYSSGNISCGNVDSCTLIEGEHTQGSDGYCAYKCTDKTDPNYYYYKMSTGLFVNIPILNNIITVKVSSETERLYDFENVLGGSA